jgi:hypothetical protein
VPPRTTIDRTRARGTVAAVEDATRQLRRSFAVAERNLTRELETITERLVFDPSLRGAAARRQQVRAVFADLADLRADLDRQALLFTRGSLSKMYVAGTVRASRALGLDPGAGSFSAAHRRALAVLASDTFDDLAAATTFVEARAKLAIREAARLGVLVGAASGTSVPQDTAALLGRFRRDGVTAFTAANGARWRLSTYAEMVVRTKSASAYNTGTVLRAREAGTDVFGIIDGDRSGHEECLAYNGKTCSGSWAFANPILHPNAVAPWTRVVPSGRLLTVWRIPWSGPIVTVRTAVAGRLSVGPHHPVLTRRGWVAGKDLEPGDQLVRRAGEVGDPAALHDLEDVPPTIEELFDTVARGGVVTRVAAAVDDFHGDGRYVDGEVDAVDADGPLPRVPHLPLVEERRERRLDRVGATVGAGALTADRASLPDLERLALSSPGGVGCCDVRRVVVRPAERQSALAQAAADHVVGHAEVERDLSGRLAAPVAFDEVVEVKVEAWSGHLYDLSTAGGVYAADDRIVSNCVRSFTPLPLHRGPVDYGEVGEPVAVSRAGGDAAHDD